MQGLISILIVFAVVIFSMVLHELAHGWTAYLLGDDTAKESGRLSLNPLKHLDPVMSLLVPMLLFISGGPVFGGAKPVPINTRKLKGGEWGMALVALAGPMMNFLLAFIGFLIGHFTGVFYGEGLLMAVLRYMVIVNLGFGVFNLVPVPPLDGSRILYAIAPDGVRELMMRIERYGFIIIYILILLGAFSSLMTGAINVILDGFYWLVGA